MRSNIFLAFALAMMGAAVFTACEKEEEIAQNMTGTWESTDLLFSRTFKGQTMYPKKTVFVFNNDREHATSGYGYAMEYYDNRELPVAYFHTRWETWTRTSTNEVGIEVKYDETGDIFKTQEPDYDLNDSEFYGQCTINTVPGTRPFRFVRGTTPDVSNVKHWGYSELLPTWHQTTFEGQLYIKREYQGQVYQPKNVVITFDVDPRYNFGMVGGEKAYIKEEYDNAPWGAYLADSLRFWDVWNDNSFMRIYRWESQSTDCDYEFMDVEYTENEMKGKIFVETNVFEPFTLRRTSTPNWESTITDWGFENKLR